MESAPSSSGANISTREAAVLIGVSTKTVLGYVKDGDLPAVNVSRGKVRPRYKFRPNDVFAFILSRTVRMIPSRQSTHASVSRPTIAISGTKENIIAALQAARPSARRGL